MTTPTPPVSHENAFPVTEVIQKLAKRGQLDATLAVDVLSYWVEERMAPMTVLRYLVVTYITYQDEVDSMEVNKVDHLAEAKQLLENHVFESTREDYDNRAVVIDLGEAAVLRFEKVEAIRWLTPPTADDEERKPKTGGP